MRLLAILSFAILFASSCTLRQSYTFNQDLSGTYELSIDMSAMAALAGGEDGEEDVVGETMKSLNIDSIQEAMNIQPGISNAVMKEEGMILSFSYNFSNVEVLNTSLKDMDLGSALSGKEKKNSETPSFEVKGKKLKYNSPELDSDSEKDGLEGMEGMGGMMKYEVSFKFAQEVKKIKGENATLSYDKKTVVLESNLEEMFSGESGLMDVEIKLK